MSLMPTSESFATHMAETLGAHRHWGTQDVPSVDVTGAPRSTQLHGFSAVFLFLLDSFLTVSVLIQIQNTTVEDARSPMGTLEPSFHKTLLTLRPQLVLSDANQRTSSVLNPKPGQVLLPLGK